MSDFLKAQIFQILLFLFLWQTNKQTLTLNGIVLCDQPQKAIDSSKDWQRAAGPLTNEGELFYVCIYVIGQAREANLEQTRQDRTSHFLKTPSG